MANKRYKDAESVIRKAAKMNGKDYKMVIEKAAERERELQSMLLKNKPEVTKRLDDDGNFVDNPDVVQESAKLEKASTNVKAEKYNVLTIFRHKIILKNSCVMWYAW